MITRALRSTSWLEIGIALTVIAMAACVVMGGK